MLFATSLSTSLTTAPINALVRLEQWTPIAALKANAFAYPILEVVHIVAIGIVFGSLWIVDLRIMGLMPKLDAQVLAKSVLPWTLAGFLLAALSGLTMFTMRIADLIANPMFIAKICLLFSAGTNAAILHARGALNLDNLTTRCQALLSIVIWIAVIFCGRWIAYV
jgi:hypothetical protein